MNHPDFRVGGKIFATLGYPDKKHGMVKLPPEQQHEFTDNEPKAFVCVKGAWGRQGATSVVVPAANGRSVQKAIEIAWRYAAAKGVSTKRKTGQP